MLNELALPETVLSLNRGGVCAVHIDRVTGALSTEAEDHLAVEEPLEIRLSSVAGARSVSITMRTPGDDFSLACGFLYTEGIVRERRDIHAVRHCGPIVGAEALRNVVRVELRADLEVDLERLTRHFYTSSSCGVCGKTSLEALHTAGMQTVAEDSLRIDPRILHGLPTTLRQAQTVFSQTGGLHAAGLFSAEGVLLALKEDVGRHNAVDKVIGAELLASRLPLTERILLVSGRASFELVQKAVVAGISCMAAVGAPSSLAVALAKRYGLTLVGFLRQDRFNVYSNGQRIAASSSPA